MSTQHFIFATCQCGAEPALKAEISRKWPAFRFAFSRPGFTTFKVPTAAALPDDFDLHSVFARSHGFSLGKAEGETVEQRAQQVWKLAESRQFDALHVWQRDLHEPGYRGYEPSLTPVAAEAEAAIRAAGGGPWSAAGGQSADTIPAPVDCNQLSQPQSAGGLATIAKTRRRFAPANTARAGELVLDCVLVEPGQWRIGYHRASSTASRWPGGMFPLELPADAVSRAFLKMEEALAWSKMPLRANDLWAEIGSAPGGASQALLSHDVKVIGIDPAEMDERVLANPNFTHWKKRGADIRRREFRKVKYLVADINVAPSYTLDTVEAIVTHAEVKIQGLLLTLKLSDWKLAEQLPEFLDRIRHWGYGQVRARQLHHNRQEVCVGARRREK
ncbi:MAG TPA: SAM-dependent methyltransferase [Pirellulales bacterium]|nr:SAM-dependent methyltransferase [Pirellulales bacterium]